jgi:hypothetical protein
MSVMRIKIGAAVFGLLLAMSAVGAASAVSDNASPKACFGQGRADYALNGEFSVGYWASQRKADNAVQNAAYRDSCQP